MRKNQNKTGTHTHTQHLERISKTMHTLSIVSNIARPPESQSVQHILYKYILLVANDSLVHKDLLTSVVTFQSGCLITISCHRERIHRQRDGEWGNQTQKQKVGGRSQIWFTRIKKNPKPKQKKMIINPLWWFISFSVSFDAVQRLPPLHKKKSLLNAPTGYYRILWFERRKPSGNGEKGRK